MSERLVYLDRLRSALTALVVLHHCAIIYGASGGWFYHELSFSSTPSSLLLTLFCATNQAWFMGLFFLLAAYFTPASLERKGYAGFWRDRLLRLGVPLAAFILILGPLTAAMVEAATGAGFWPCIRWLWQHQRIINGPLWFTEALLIFAALYCLLRRLFGPALTHTERTPRLLPHFALWVASAVAVGLAAFLLRLVTPVGENYFGLQLGFFASYIFLFAFGILAWRSVWLEQITRRRLWPVILCAVLFWPLLPAALMLGAKAGGKLGFAGGWNMQAFIYALWEPLVAWGAIAAVLILFRRFANRGSVICDWIDRRAYGVFILHPPILTGVALLLRGWQVAPLAKFALVGALSLLLCWIAADLLLRLPGARRVL